MRHSYPVGWLDLRGITEAYRLLSVFRASNPMLGSIAPEDLHWEVSWTEVFTPLDMNTSAEARATKRATAVTHLVLACAVSPDAIGPRVSLCLVPQIVRLQLLQEEEQRQ